MRQVGYLPEIYEDARSEKYKNYLLCWVAVNITKNHICIAFKALKWNTDH
jgi:hypothetical protein